MLVANKIFESRLSLSQSSGIPFALKSDLMKMLCEVDERMNDRGSRFITKVLRSVDSEATNHAKICTICH